VPEYLHQAGKLDPRVSFEELARASHINARAQAADAAPDFRGGFDDGPSHRGSVRTAIPIGRGSGGGAGRRGAGQRWR
jgi:hypothetical protein